MSEPMLMMKETQKSQLFLAWYLANPLKEKLK